MELDSDSSESNTSVASSSDIATEEEEIYNDEGLPVQHVHIQPYMYEPQYDMAEIEEMAAVGGGAAAAGNEEIVDQANVLDVANW